MTSDIKNKKLALAICDFLTQSIENGTIKSDDAEGIEVAVQCIAEAFGVDPDDSTQVEELSIKPASLLSIFEVVLKTQNKVSSTSVSSSDAVQNDPESKKKAEELKGKGNTEMGQKNYVEAIKLYTEAIKLDSENAVYYANRAAAFSHNGEHERAVDDAKKSIEVDPKYSKALSRMGHAYFSLGKYEEAVKAYEDGVALDPTNELMKQSLAAAKSKTASASPTTSSPSDAVAEPETSTRGAGGFPGVGGPGGLDFGSMMNNPNFMSMASQMMNNPAFGQMAQNLMSNPDALRNLMSDPNVADMAKNFMGGQK